VDEAEGMQAAVLPAHCDLQEKAHAVAEGATLALKARRLQRTQPSRMRFDSAPAAITEETQTMLSASPGSTYSSEGSGSLERSKLLVRRSEASLNVRSLGWISTQPEVASLSDAWRKNKDVNLVSASTSPAASEASELSFLASWSMSAAPSTHETLSEAYVLGRVTATGSTSRVQCATRRSDNKDVALKILLSRDEEMLLLAKAEYDMLRRLNHENILSAFDFHVVGGHAVLALEYMSGGTVQEAVVSAAANGLGEAVCRRLIRQLVNAVGYLHGQGIVHRDIKPENLLLSENGTRLCLADFNVATQTAHTFTPAGTFLYSPPEVLCGQPSTEAGDIWAIGLCAYFMASGSLPQGRGKGFWNRAGLRKHSKQEVTFDGEQLRSLTPSGRTFMADCLRVEETERPTASQVAGHDWLQVATP